MGFTSERCVRRIAFALFFLSGACGLVYEVVWMMGSLAPVFDATAPAAATVLSSFFAGLALGSLPFCRMAERARSPLLLYALLEAGIGSFAFLRPLLPPSPEGDGRCTRTDASPNRSIA